MSGIVILRLIYKAQQYFALFYISYPTMVSNTEIVYIFKIVNKVNKFESVGFSYPSNLMSFMIVGFIVA